MLTVRKMLAGLAITGLGGLILALAAPPAWATGDGGGGGGAGLQYQFQYAPDEDEEEATDEPEGYSFTAKYDYKFSSSLGVNFVYEHEMVQEETETPTIRYYSPMWGSTSPYGMMMRFDYRFPTMEIEEEEEQPASTYQGLKIKYKFQTWVDNDALEAVDEDPLRGLDPDKYVWDEDEGLGLRVGDFIIKVDMTPEAARAFQDWDRSEEKHEQAQEWLGDDAFNKLQEQFGHQEGGDAPNGGGTNQSNWNNAHYYCGATCVYSYE